MFDLDKIEKSLQEAALKDTWCGQNIEKKDVRIKEGDFVRILWEGVGFGLVMS